jgi:carboxyl-terminal processing protease
MTRNHRTVWIAVSALSLSAFSFAAGFGIRSLATTLSPVLARGSRAVATGLASRAAASYPRVASTAPGAGDPDLRPAELFKDVYNKLHIYYVEPLPSETKLAEGSIEQMLASLDDPNTRLISPREWSAIRDEAEGSLHGLGAVLTIRKYKGQGTTTEREITVVSVLPGSAAEKAGLQAGDRITYLDGHWIAPLHLSFRDMTQIEDNLGPQDVVRPQRPDEGAAQPDSDPDREKRRKDAEEARRRWLGSTDLVTAMETLQAGTPAEHELTVKRGAADKPLKLKVTFADGKFAPFASRKINNTTGYLRLGTLNANSAKEVEEALTGFQRDGVQNLVVDLRESPGGSLDAVKAIVGELAPGAPVLVSKERDASRKLVDRKVNAPAGQARLKPAAISVLVDGGTAGSSEVLAAALHDDLSARVVGTQTFGDGTEQQVVQLPNGAAISISHAQMLSPKGTVIEGKGLKPDYPAPPGEQEGIEAAVRALAMPARPAAAATTTGRR